MNYIQKGTPEFSRANWALFAAGFITFMNLYITQPILPLFSKEFDVSPAYASLSLSLTTFSLAVSLVIVGSLSEAWGRKRMMTISIFTASILTLAIAFSPTFEVLLVLRIIQGVAFAGLPAIAMAYLGEEMNSRDLGMAMGLYISGNSVGGLAGRIIMGTLTDLFNWQVGMICIGVLSLLISIYFVTALPQSKHFKPQKLQLGSLTSSLVSHLKDTTLLKLYGIGFFLMASFVTLYNYIGFKLLAPPYSLSTTIVGSIFIVYLVGTVSSTWFGNLANKHGRQRILLSGIALMLIGSLITLNGILFLKIIGITILTFGFFGAHSIASSWVSHRAKHDRAQASSLYLFFYYFGSSVGGTAGGFLWSKFGWEGVIALITFFLLISFVLVILLKTRDKK